MEKIGFFEGIAKSFYSFKDYPRFIKDRGGKTFLYMLFLMVIMLLADAVISAKIKAGISAVFNSDTFPKWSINAEEGTISFERKFIVGGDNSSSDIYDDYPNTIANNLFIAIDTNSDFYIDSAAGTVLVYDYITDSVVREIPFENGFSTRIALVGRTAISMLNQGKLQTVSFAEMNPDMLKMLDYDNVMNFMNNSLITIIFVCIAIYIFIAVLFGCLIQSVIASIQNSGKTGLTFGSLFKMSVHARTIPTVLCAIVMVLGINVGWLWLINYVIGAVFIHFAIKEYKQYAESLEIDRTAELNSMNANNNIDPSDYNTPFNNINGTVASYNAGAANNVSLDKNDAVAETNTNSDSSGIDRYGYGINFGNNDSENKNE